MLRGLITCLTTLSLSLVIGCSAGSKMYQHSDLQNKQSGLSGRSASVHIAGIDFECKIVGLNKDVLIVQQSTLRSEIPLDAISKLEVRSAMSQKSNMLIGGGAGLLVGAGAGLIIGPKVSEAKGVKTLAGPLPMLMIIGGAVGGGFLGSSLAENEEYVFNAEIKPYSIHTEIGTEATPAELVAYGIFDDLSTGADEKILQVQVFQLKDNRYFIMYDESYLGAYRVGGKIVNEEYIKKQAEKVSKKQ
ncbi:hypothetical protein L6Q79_05865 [bacterium]|nr:hypothetical protein [bacterium]NUN44443.1 hypothetical protein [bacterium]